MSSALYNFLHRVYIWYDALTRESVLTAVCVCVCLGLKLLAIHGEDGELPSFLGYRQHNDGDGTSGSSHGTSSPDSFHEATDDLKVTHHQHDQQVPVTAASETNDDVVVMPQDLLAGSYKCLVSD